MRVRSIKFAALLLASAAALALPSALPVQSLPQWVTLKGEDGDDVLYDFNSLKALPNGIKQIDTYQPRIKVGNVGYISCSKWRYTVQGSNAWDIIPPGSKSEILAYKLCGGKLSNRPARSLSYPTCSGSSLDCALERALERFSLSE
jgi:hypothetical protein